MADVSISLVYEELKQVKKELHELRGSLIPMEKITADEHKELNAIEAEMQAGKATNWREALHTY